MNWLTLELKDEIKKVFEPRYRKLLTEEEVIDISNNLTDFLETFIKFRLRKEKNEQ